MVSELHSYCKILYACFITLSWLLFLVPCRAALCKESAGSGEASGAHVGRPEEVLCPAASTGAPALCSSAGSSHWAQDTQSPPCRDAHVLANERPQVHPSALWNLGRSVTRKWRSSRSRMGLVKWKWTFQPEWQFHGPTTTFVYFWNM